MVREDYRREGTQDGISCLLTPDQFMDALVARERFYHLPTADVAQEVAVGDRPDVVRGDLGTGAKAVPLEDGH
eukprot:7774573-Alexandrium_andersonii.AAC.1